MKGYAKVTVTNEEKKLMRESVDKAIAFMNRYYAGEYQTKKKVRYFLFFTEEKTITDTVKLQEDAYKGGCEIEYRYGRYWADFSLQTKAYTEILRMSEQDEIYLDNELCFYFNELTKEQK